MDSDFFQNVVYVQTLITLVWLDTEECGINFCTKYVWKDENDPGEVLCIKWTRFFNLDYLNENMKDLSLKHSVQDVLPPFAMLAKINLEIADLCSDTNGPNEKIFNMMNEALEMCMFKALADIRNKGYSSLVRSKKEGKLLNWINDGVMDYCTPFQFNSHYLVHPIRSARSDLVEFYANLEWANYPD